MKVCAVTTWPPHRDGVALYSTELYNHLITYADVQVIANIPKQQTLPESYEENKVTVLKCWKRGLLYPLQIFRSIQKTRCHLVHLQHGWLLYGGIIYALLFSCLLAALRFSHKPTIVTMHTIIRNDASIYRNYFANLLARIAVLFISKSILHLSNKIIVHNSLMKKTLQTEYGAKEEKLVIISHGIKKASEKPESFQKNKELSILSLGFLRKEKGTEYLIEAFKKLSEKCPNSKLVIVGATHAHDKTGYTKNLKNLITSKLKKQVIFLGFVDEQRLERLIWKSDIIVLQSTDHYYVEASGTLAAVADYGKALVCSKVPKFQSELKHKLTCMFVEPFNPVELSQTLLLLTGDNELRKCLGKNLKEKFEDRNWSAVAKQHATLYRSIFEKTHN